MYETLFPSLLITFREALEAAFIVTIMVTYLRKTGKEEHSRYAYTGAGVALLLSLLIGYGVQAVYGSLGETQSQVFEGVAALTAVVVLTYMIMWMRARRTSTVYRMPSCSEHAEHRADFT